MNKSINLHKSLGAIRTNCTNQVVLTVLEVGISQRELSTYGTFYHQV